MRAHHGVERDLLAVPEAVVLQPGSVPALAGVVVVADVGVGAGEHHLGIDYHKGKDRCILNVKCGLTSEGRKYCKSK